MHTQPTAKQLYTAFAHPWLSPVRFGVKPYLQFCDEIDKGLRELEARHPSHPKLSIADRRQQLLRRPR